MASRRTKKHSNPTPTPEVLFTLPVTPDRWELHPAVTSEEGEIVTPEQLVFYVENQPVLTILDPQTKLQALTTILGNRDLDNQHVPDAWTIQTPTGEPDADPVMTFTRKGRILATTSLDQKRLKSITRALNRHIYKPAGISTLMKTWWLNHKVARVFVVVLLLPVLFLIAYSFVWGFQV